MEKKSVTPSPIEAMARAIYIDSVLTLSSCKKLARAALKALKKWERQQFNAGRLVQSHWITVKVPKNGLKKKIAGSK